MDYTLKPTFKPISPVSHESPFLTESPFNSFSSHYCAKMDLTHQTASFGDQLNLQTLVRTYFTCYHLKSPILVDLDCINIATIGTASERKWRGQSTTTLSKASSAHQWITQ